MHGVTLGAIVGQTSIDSCDGLELVEVASLEPRQRGLKKTIICLTNAFVFVHLCGQHDPQSFAAFWLAAIVCTLLVIVFNRNLYGLVLLHGGFLLILHMDQSLPPKHLLVRFLILGIIRHRCHGCELINPTCHLELQMDLRGLVLLRFTQRTFTNVRTVTTACTCFTGR